MKRLERLVENLKGKGDIALVIPGTNFYYLTNIDVIGTLERLFLLVVPAESSPFILAPKLYEGELDKVDIDVYLWKDEEDPYEVLKKLVKIENKRILIDDSMPAGTLLKIFELYRGNDFLPLSSIMRELRMIKDDGEIEYIKKSASIADNVFNKIISENLRGNTEIQVSNIIDTYIHEFGGENKAFDTIVASGSNGSDPHHKPENKKIVEGDVVILDYGAKFKGYCSDITRTIFIGEISEEEKKVYSIVKKAQESAIKSVKKGVRAMDVDKVARDVISINGYGEYFIHRTGHGIGLDVHEEPFINSTNSMILRNGMIFTVEPGIYIKGKFGIRIEDDILLNEIGIEITRAEKNMLIL